MEDRIEFSEGLDGLEKRFVDLIENRTPLGIMSGLSGMDQLLGGFKPAELSIIAARTGVGKTAFMAQIAREAYLKGKKIAFFSLEMPTIQIASRLFIGYAKLNATILSHGGAGLTAIEKREALKVLTDGMNELRQMKNDDKLGSLWIIDDRRISVDDIRRHCEEMGDLDMVFVDYIQLASPPKEDKSKDRHIQLGEVSMELHSLAGDLSVPVIAGAQIKRLGRGNKPGLEDLRESGSLEQDSDQVIILDRELDENGSLPKEGFGTISVLKNRHGLGGVCDFYYTGRYFLFEDERSIKPKNTEYPSTKGKPNIKVGAFAYGDQTKTPLRNGDEPKRGTEQEYDFSLPY